MTTPQLTQPVFLCGMMGAGKSTIGKILAAKSGVPFSDLDSLIESSENMSIPEIFDSHGEQKFRETERSILLEHAKKAEGIIALGGGSLQNQQLVDHIKLSGWLIFLNVPVKELIKRLKNSANRPMLENSDLEKKIKQLLKERLPFYNQAHITIHTNDMDAEEIAENILKKLRIYENTR